MTDKKTIIKELDKAINACDQTGLAEFQGVIITRKTAQDIKELLREKEAVKPDYKKYISIEWLKKYASLCCTFDMNKNAIHFVDTWFKMNEMCCCEKNKEDR